MKKILFTLFAVAAIPFIGHSQCANYLTGDTAQVIALKEVVEKYMQLNLEANEPKSLNKSISYRSYSDSIGFVRFGFGLERKKEIAGTEVIYKSPEVINITIYGPAERIDKMVSEYFTPIIEPCHPKKSPTWFFWNKLKLVYVDAGERKGIPMKTITIEKA